MDWRHDVIRLRRDKAEQITCGLFFFIFRTHVKFVQMPAKTAIKREPEVPSFGLVEFAEGGEWIDAPVSTASHLLQCFEDVFRILMTSPVPSAEAA